CAPVTWVPWAASSSRRLLVTDHSAAFVEEYAPGVASQLSAEWMSTNAPPPLRARTGANARAIASGPKTFASYAARTSSSEAASRLRGPETPALLITMVASAALAAAAATAAGSV